MIPPTMKARHSDTFPASWLLWPFYLMVLFLLCNCARQAPPPGGPPDETPPEIIEVNPAPNAIHVNRDTKIAFRFSEKIDRRSFETAFFIAPDPSLQAAAGRPLRFHGGGQQLEVEFPDSLRANTTYVVTVGTDLRDRRNNRMEESFSFAFSTGEHIDQGKLEGQVYDQNPAGILILSYGLDEAREPDPAADFADFYTQTGKNGGFALTHLAPGKYRVFALADQFNDRLYNRGEDRIGVPARDFTIGENGQADGVAFFRLTHEDTLKPSLSTATAASILQVIWQFDEAVVPQDSLLNRHLHLVAADGKRIEALLAASHPLNPGQVFSVLREPLREVQYQAFVDSLYDRSGNLIDSAFAKTEFAGTTRPDTIQPQIVKISIADSARNIALDAAIDVYFSELMRNDSLTKLLAVKDGSGAQAPGQEAWQNRFHYRYVPLPHWRGRSKYVVEIQADSVFDWNGNALFDTTRQIVFWTLNQDTLGSISGKMSDGDSSASGALFVTARQSAGGNEYESRVEAPGAYHFAGVFPGLYVISAYRDANHNGRYDYGQPFPFTPAERFMAWPDTIKVRSRWPNEGNDFVLPR